MKKVDKDLKPFSSTGPAPPPKERKFAPVSPILNENEIVAQLSCQLDPTKTNAPTRTASALAIIDVYDRGIPRGPFTQVVNRAVNLNERIREVEIMSRLRMDLTAEGHTLETVLGALDKLLLQKYTEAEQYRMGLWQDMCHVREMAWDDDPIQ